MYELFLYIFHWVNQHEFMRPNYWQFAKKTGKLFYRVSVIFAFYPVVIKTINVKSQKGKGFESPAVKTNPEVIARDLWEFNYVNNNSANIWSYTGLLGASKNNNWNLFYRYFWRKKHIYRIQSGFLSELTENFLFQVNLDIKSWRVRLIPL